MRIMKVTFGKAITDALNEEMRRDSKVVLYGEDIAEFGNIFGLTRGMLEEYGPKRVRNTPITETAIIGSAIGAAETGLRPCVELMYSDFTTVCFAEIFHCVAKWRYMHGPEYKLPLVIRNASGSANGAGSEHSNCVESLFMHAPGLTVVTPSCAYDAKGLLKSAIRSDNPVLFCEPKLLYQSKQEIPDEIYHSDYTIPLGQADVKRQGKDVTLVAVGLMVPRAMEAGRRRDRGGGGGSPYHHASGQGYHLCLYPEDPPGGGRRRKQQDRRHRRRVGRAVPGRAV
jgi:pyruvate/2-oxoglutarate/acetoin dehydrogenase E1 component